MAPPARSCSDLSQKLQDASVGRVLVLPLDRHIPIVRPRQAFLKIARRGRRVRRIMARNDERWNIQAHEILRLGTGRSVAVEQRAAHAPPRGSAPNGLPSLATSATTPSRPSLETKARCSAKR